MTQLGTNANEKKYFDGPAEVTLWPVDLVIIV